MSLEFDRQLNMRVASANSKSMQSQNQSMQFEEMSVQSLSHVSQGQLLNPELSERIRLNNQQSLSNFIGNSDDFS